METTSFDELKEHFNSPEFISYGMSRTQMDNFIFAMQITSHRVAKQFLSELHVRYNSQDTNELDLEQLEAEREILLEELHAADTPGKKKLADVKIKKKDHDIRMVQTTLRQTKREIDDIVASLNHYEEVIGQKITDLDLDDEVQEREYWVKRLSKQAGLDLITSGRISMGNMEAVMALPDNERNKVLANSLAITHAIKAEMETAEQLMLEQTTPTMMIENKQDILGNKLEIE